MDEQDRNDSQAALRETFDGPRDAMASGVVVADGYGVDLRIERGQLQVSDGFGRHRRRRCFGRTVGLRRVVVLGSTGTVTLAAASWLADVGAALVVVDTDGRALLSSASSPSSDARLLRAQAWAPWEPVGLVVARYLVGAKLAGQATTAADVLGSPAVAGTIEALAAGCDAAADLAALRLIEAQGAACYFSAWSNVGVRFARADQARVPPHWLRPFAGRASPLGSGSNRNAVHPVGAMLNYLSAIAEAEAVMAARALGLAPELGVLHFDTPARASMALDLMEPARAGFETMVLHAVEERTFRARDFTETSKGTCRILAPLTHDLAAAAVALGRAVAPVAEAVATMLARSSDRPIAIRTPLTGRRLNDPPPPRLPLGRTCGDCGAPAGRRAQRCGACTATRRTELAQRASEAATAAARRRRENGNAPSDATLAGRAKAGAGIAAARARARDAAAAGIGIDWPTYRDAILPALGSLPPSTIARATGLSPSSASKIKAGRQIAAPAHWPALARVVGVKPAAPVVDNDREGRTLTREDTR